MKNEIEGTGERIDRKCEEAAQALVYVAYMAAQSEGNSNAGRAYAEAYLEEALRAYSKRGR